MECYLIVKYSCVFFLVSVFALRIAVIAFVFITKFSNLFCGGKKTLFAAIYNSSGETISLIQRGTVCVVGLDKGCVGLIFLTSKYCG